MWWRPGGLFVFVDQERYTAGDGKSPFDRYMQGKGNSMTLYKVG